MNNRLHDVLVTSLFYFFFFLFLSKLSASRFPGGCFIKQVYQISQAYFSKSGLF